LHNNQKGVADMKAFLLILTVIVSFLAIAGTAMALPVSNTDLWQNAAITIFSSAHSATGNNHNGLFDGLEAGYGNETGNALFADGSSAGTTHFVECLTSGLITVNSINLTTYHDFDQYNIGGPRIVELDAYDTAQPVPEQATMLLLGTGIALVGAGRKKFKKGKIN